LGRLYQTKFKVDKPKNGSLESWIDPTLKYAFIDFASFNRLFPKSSETFTMREWRYLTSRDKWNKIFDGVFYIKDMYPCDP